MKQRKIVRFTCPEGHVFRFFVPADQVEKVRFCCPEHHQECAKEVPT